MKDNINININCLNNASPSSINDRATRISPLEIVDNLFEGRLTETILLSVIIPVHNEEDNILLLYKEIVAALEGLQLSFEIIFIDDGSTDGGFAELSKIASNDSKVKIIKFRMRYGQTAALNAGFKYSQGEIVVTLDGDLQNDPADIPRLLEKMAEGFDMVCGWRKNRMDKLFSRRIPSEIANRIINWLITGTGVRLHDFGCTLKAYKKGIIKNVNLYGEMHRFVPVFAAWLGVKITEIPVNHRYRIHGAAKYNLSRVSRVILDLIVVRFFADYLTRPIQFFGRIAKIITINGSLAIIALSIFSFLDYIPVSLNTILILTAILLFAIIQFISLGLLGEIIMRSFFEGHGKNIYVVEKIISINNGINNKACEIQF
jgi:glycosyltransferase involved in cell wall biosynthesis